MRTLYLDCFAGVSGDMLVGALLDCGLSIDALKEDLSKLQLPGYQVTSARVDRSGISATKFDVHIEPASHDHQHEDEERDDPNASAHAEHDPHPHRSLSSIRRLIESSALSEGVRQRAIGIFDQLGKAEAKVHNVPIETVEFHEVGAIDSIIDIVGASICLEMLQVERVGCSALHVGSGTFECAHGTYPVPGPATAEILRGIPIYSGTIRGELVTPTGAAIVSSIAEYFGPLPELILEATGYGAGTRQYQGFPNVLRVFVGSEAEAATPTLVTVIETNIDDLNPQVFGYLLDRLLIEGALDVFYTPVQMKKNRPGVLLTVLAKPTDQARLCDILFRETTTLGVRYRLEQRVVLQRSHVPVVTPYGEIRIKIARDRDHQMVNHAPEFDDCLVAARKHEVALREVQLAAIAAFLALGRNSTTSG